MSSPYSYKISVQCSCRRRIGGDRSPTWKSYWRNQNWEVETERQSTIESRRPWWAVSDYKVYKNLRKPGYIDHWIDIGSDCRSSAFARQQVIEFSLCYSALIIIPLSQLSSDDLKNVRQALMMHNSLNILLVIKHLFLDLGLGRLFPERIYKIKVTKRRRAFSW